MDIELKDNKNLTWKDGDLKLVDGLKLIKQHILTALYTLKGDWLLNDEKGIDFPRGFRNEAFLLNDIRKQIIEVDGVNQIEKIKLVKEGVKISIFAIVLTNYGNIELNEVVTQ